MEGRARNCLGSSAGIRQVPSCLVRHVSLLGTPCARARPPPNQWRGMASPWLGDAHRDGGQAGATSRAEEPQQPQAVTCASRWSRRRQAMVPAQVVGAGASGGTDTGDAPSAAELVRMFEEQELQEWLQTAATDPAPTTRSAQPCSGSTASPHSGTGQRQRPRHPQKRDCTWIKSVFDKVNGNIRERRSQQARERESVFARDGDDEVVWEDQPLADSEIPIASTCEVRAIDDDVGRLSVVNAPAEWLGKIDDAPVGCSGEALVADSCEALVEVSGDVPLLDSTPPASSHTGVPLPDSARPATPHAGAPLADSAPPASPHMKPHVVEPPPPPSGAPSGSLTVSPTHFDFPAPRRSAKVAADVNAMAATSVGPPGVWAPQRADEWWQDGGEYWAAPQWQQLQWQQPQWQQPQWQQPQLQQPLQEAGGILAAAQASIASDRGRSVYTGETAQQAGPDFAGGWCQAQPTQTTLCLEQLCDPTPYAPASWQGYAAQGW